MAISERALQHHDELFPGYASSLKVSDPELIEYFDNFSAATPLSLILRQQEL